MCCIGQWPRGSVHSVLRFPQCSRHASLCILANIVNRFVSTVHTYTALRPSRAAIGLYRATGYESCLRFNMVFVAHNNSRCLLYKLYGLQVYGLPDFLMPSGNSSLCCRIMDEHVHSWHQDKDTEGCFISLLSTTIRSCPSFAMH